jgi:hypothetical protein
MEAAAALDDRVEELHDVRPPHLRLCVSLRLAMRRMCALRGTC